MAFETVMRRLCPPVRAGNRIVNLTLRDRPIFGVRLDFYETATEFMTDDSKRMRC